MAFWTTEFGAYPLASREWCNQNESRQFPLREDCDGKDISGLFKIAPSCFVDLIICCPPINTSTGSLDRDSFYIRQILVGSTITDITLAVMIGDTSYDVGVFRNLSADIERHEVIYMEVTNAYIDLSANLKALGLLHVALRVGSLLPMFKTPGLWTFDKAKTTIDPQCVTIGSFGISGFQLGSEIVSGVISLKAGPGIFLGVSDPDDQGNRALTISGTRDVSAEDIISLDSDAAVLQAITEHYGAPICSINNIKPDEQGVLHMEGNDCTEVVTENGMILLKNPCNTPCCERMTEEIAALTDAMRENEDTMQTLQAAYVDLLKTLSTMNLNIQTVCEGNCPQFAKE